MKLSLAAALPLALLVTSAAAQEVAAPVLPPPVRGRVCAVAALPSEDLVAVAWEGGEFGLVSRTDGTTQQVVARGAALPQWWLAASPDGRTLAALDTGGALRLVDLAADAPRVVARQALPRPAEPRAGTDDTACAWSNTGRTLFGGVLSWSPTSARLVVLDRRGNASLWSASGDGLARWQLARPAGVPQVAWTPDGAALLLVEGAHVRWLRAEDGAPLARDGAPRELDAGAPVVALALSPDGARLATGHVGCALKLWDAASGALVREERYPDPLFPEDDDEIAALAWSPDGTRLAYSTREGTEVGVLAAADLARVWRSEFLGAHFFEAMRLAWSPDGAALWFAFECGVGQLYRVAPEASAKASALGTLDLPVFAGAHAVALGCDGLATFDADGARQR